MLIYQIDSNRSTLWGCRVPPHTTDVIPKTTFCQGTSKLIYPLDNDFFDPSHNFLLLHICQRAKTKYHFISRFRVVTFGLLYTYTVSVLYCFLFNWYVDSALVWICLWNSKQRYIIKFQKMFSEITSQP